MKFKSCTGSCEQGRRICNCSAELNADHEITDIVILFIVAMFVIGLLMEIVNA